MHTIFNFLLLLSAFSLVRNAPMKMEDSKKYLNTYGYLPNLQPKDIEYKEALENFQRSNSLPVTGKMDTKTTKLMQRPRCGKPDNLTNIFTRNPWGKSVLTYKFQSFPRNGLSRSTAMKEISRAFEVWAKHIPVEFQFRQEGPVDIDISFPPAQNGDGPGNTLAYAYFPRVGDIFFDAEQWSANSPWGTNLFNTAAHEIGHSLGLEHTNNERALMNPYILPYNPNLSLYPDDIRRVQNLYGPKTVSRRQPKPDICNTNRIDTTFFSLREQALYIIKDDYAWKLKDRKIEPGYPKEINKVWPGIPNKIDAAYSFKNDIYFAKDRKIMKYNGKIHDYRKLVKHLDATEVINNKLYLFSGSEMWSFSMSRNKQNLESGFPKQINEYWEGAPSTIDTLYYDQKEFFYLFKDSNVYKYNQNQELVETLPLKLWLPCYY